MENADGIANFYLKSRKILMQFFFEDSNHRYHDAENIKLELGNNFIKT